MKQVLGIILTAALTVSIVSGTSYNQSVEATKQTDVKWLQEIQTQAKQAHSLDGKVVLEKTTLAQVHKAYKGEKSSNWCQSGNGLASADRALHYCSNVWCEGCKSESQCHRL